MSSFNILAIVVTMAAVFSYLNHRHFRLPTTIALMIMSLALSLGLLLVARVSPWADAVDKQVWGWLEKLSFSKTFLGGILGFWPLPPRPCPRFWWVRPAGCWKGSG
jgi:CPA1 family monovalent cation:H+ antiporter